jgi:hypothetical protein
MQTTKRQIGLCRSLTVVLRGFSASRAQKYLDFVAGEVRGSIVRPWGGRFLLGCSEVHVGF